MRHLPIAALALAVAGPAQALTWSLDSHVDYPFVDQNMTGLQMTQGIDWNAEAGEWVTSWQYGLARFTADWQYIAGNSSYDLATGTLVSGIPDSLLAQGLDHIGDFAIVDGVIQAPLDTTDGYTDGHVALYDAVTLEYLGLLYPMTGAPANPNGDVASWTGADAAAGLGYGKEWRNGDTINVYDLSDWSFLHTLQMDQSLRNIQGGKVLDGQLYLSSDNSTYSVYGVGLADGHVEELFQLPLPEGDYNFEMEGLALRQRADGTVEMYVELIIDPAAVDGEIDAMTRLYRYVGTPSPVPVPASLSLALSGIAALALLGRRRRA